MRVLYWTEAFWPAIGGIEVLGARFVGSLGDRGHEVMVVASNAGLDLPDDALYGGIPIRRFPFWTALAPGGHDQFLRVRQGVARLQREFEPDLVHLVCVGPGTIFLLQTRQACPAPLLVTMQQVPTSFEAAGPARLLASTLRAADWVACCSESMREELRALSGHVVTSVSVIANALPPPPLDPTAPASSPPTLLCVGRLAPEKGFDIALMAFAEIGHLFPSARLVLVGDGPLRGSLEELARSLAIADRVEFRGWLPPEEVPAAMNESTAVLVPSRHEPFGLVALEAAFMERPVVAARVGGLREVVANGESGLHFTPEDPGALAQAVTYLLSHPDQAARLGRGGRARALALYSWERYVGAYDALYHKLQEVRHVSAG